VTAHPSTHWPAALTYTGEWYAKDPICVAWLDHTRFVLFGHGWDLVDAMGKSGLAGNIHIVDQVLTYWFVKGILRPCPTASPSVHQQFMGHGGSWWSDMKKRPESHPPSFFGWEPVRSNPAPK